MKTQIELAIESLQAMAEHDPEGVAPGARLIAIGQAQALALIAIAEALEQILHELKVQGGGFPR